MNRDRRSFGRERETELSERQEGAGGALPLAGLCLGPAPRPRLAAAGPPGWDLTNVNFGSAMRPPSGRRRSCRCSTPPPAARSARIAGCFSVAHVAPPGPAARARWPLSRVLSRTVISVADMGRSTTRLPGGAGPANGIWSMRPGLVPAGPHALNLKPERKNHFSEGLPLPGRRPGPGHSSDSLFLNAVYREPVRSPSKSFIAIRYNVGSGSEGGPGLG